jgi:SAM-dependent methyltransferase
VQKNETTAEFSIEEDPFFAQDLAQMAKANNYRRWQFNLIAPYIKGKVLEVGGGIGNFTADLAKISESVISLEPNAYCYKQLVEKTQAVRNVTTYNITAEVLDQQIDPAYRADTVVCMNVLEHLKDDELAVNVFSKRLKVGGTLVLLIPAVPWLFGEIDQRLGHYRRYSKASARDLMQRTGYDLVKLRYFNFIGVWAWLWNARVTKTPTQKDSQIFIFDHLLVPWISRVEAVLPAPLGQSLLVVAIKKP